MSAVVSIVLYLVIAGIIFGLLWYLLNYCESQFPGASPLFKIGRILLVILAVLVVIGILLSLVGGQPLFRP